MAAQVWTTGRKVAGNLLPFLIASPLLGWGAWKMVQAREVSNEGLAWCAAGIVALWLGVNFFGLFRNGSLKRALMLRLKASVYDAPEDPFFVGFARPAFKSALDPHEDIGFVLLYPDRIEFFGDRNTISLPKSCLTGVRMRPNPHSWALLGGWVSVEGVLEKETVRMLFEPRERSTLWGNRGLRRELMKKVKGWMERS